MRAPSSVWRHAYDGTLTLAIIELPSERKILDHGLQRNPSKISGSHSHRGIGALASATLEHVRSVRLSGTRYETRRNTCREGEGSR